MGSGAGRWETPGLACGSLSRTKGFSGRLEGTLRLLLPLFGFSRKRTDLTKFPRSLSGEAGGVVPALSAFPSPHTYSSAPA